VSLENGKAYLKYHQSRDNRYGRFMILDCPEDAAWFDDLPGNGQFWEKPKKKSLEVVSANELPEMPQKRPRNDDGKNVK